MVVIAVRGEEKLTQKARSALDAFYKSKENADYYDLMDYLLQVLEGEQFDPAEAVGYLFEYTSPQRYVSPTYNSRSPSPFANSPSRFSRSPEVIRERVRNTGDVPIGEHLSKSVEKSQNDVYGGKSPQENIGRSPNTQRLLEDDTIGSNYLFND